jgi:hypothetical protein
MAEVVTNFLEDGSASDIRPGSRAGFGNIMLH